MNMDQNIEARLWDYLDGISQPPEKSAVEALIETNTAWRAKYHELLEVQQMMHGATELDAPSMRFTQNVMEQIAMLQISPATKTYINKKIIYGIAAFFVTVIIGFLAYGMSQMDWSATMPANSRIPDISKVNFGRFFNSTFVNVFMMMNVVLGLGLLDMYLNNRKKASTAEPI